MTSTSDRATDGRTDISLGIQYRVLRSAKHAPRDRTLSDNSAPRSVTQWSTPLRGVEKIFWGGEWITKRQLPIFVLSGKIGTGRDDFGPTDRQTDGQTSRWESSIGFYSFTISEARATGSYPFRQLRPAERHPMVDAPAGRRNT